MSNETKELYEFSGFRLNVYERLLLDSDGKRVSLTEKAFATLCVLVQKSGTLVRKEDLLETVWDGAFVEENNLDKNISALRRALGEKHKKTVFIETVRKHGYRFVAEVVRVENKEEFPPENTSANNLPPAPAKISDNHHYAVERQSNVLAVADWQAERKTEVVENSPTQPNNKTALHVVPPVASAAVRRGWSSNYIAGLVIFSALLIGGLAFSINRLFNSKAQNSQNSFERIKFRKVVGSDGGYSPTISPDGKTAAYRDANSIIWIENLTTGSRIQLKNGDESVKGTWLKFAPDGNYLYYISTADDAPDATLEGIYRVAVPNGVPRKIAGNTLTGAAVSPDGKRIAFVRQDGGANIEYAIFIANTDGTDERKIASHSSPNWFGLWGNHLAWSPDGTKIATTGGSPDYKPGDLPNVIVINIADGAEFFVPNPDWQTIEFDELTWMPDGRDLLVVAKDTTSSPYQIWQVSYPQGVWRRITNDLNNYFKVDVSADGKTLITAQEKSYSHIWQMPFADTTRARQLTSGQTYKDGSAGLALTPDGDKIIYASSESGNYEIWSANIDGEHRRQLTFDSESATEPIVTPDNGYIIFTRTTNRTSHLWRMNLDGGNLTQLTRGVKGELDRPAITPDSRFVIYTALTEPPRTGLFRIPIDGGEPVELTDKFGGWMPVISPDGKWIAYNFYDHETTGLPWRLGIMPAAGGAPVKNIEQPLRGLVRWTTDSQSLLYLDKTWMNIWQMPIFTGDAPKQITDFKTGLIRRFALSQDGKQLILACGTTETNIVLIENDK